MARMALDWDAIGAHLGSELVFVVPWAAPGSAAQDIALRRDVIDGELMQLKALQTEVIGRPGRQLRFKMRGAAPAEVVLLTALREAGMAH
eukprot:7346012-Pyramimonas_sp.AAC.1